VGSVGKTFKDVLVAKDPVQFNPNEDVHEALGVQPLADVSYEVLFKLPPDGPPKLKTPEELVASAAPLEASELLAAKRAKVAETKQTLALLSDGHELRAAAQELLDQQEAAVAKLLKKAPGSKLQVEQLRTARQGQQEALTKWEQVCEDGKAKAMTKRDAHLKLIDDQVQQLTDKRKAVLAASTSAEAAWARHHEQRRLQWQALLTEFDHKIAEMELAPALNAVDADMPIVVQDPAPPATDPLAAAQEQTRAANQALAAVQAAHAKALADKQEAERCMAVVHEAQLRQKSHEFTAADLPQQVGEPSAEHWPLLHNLWCALQTLHLNEALVGAPIPVTFGDLKAGLSVPRTLLGEAIWKKAFPAEDPNEATVLSNQLKQLLGLSLEAHRGKLAADLVRQEAASSQMRVAVEEIVTAFKKRRREGDGGVLA